MRSTLLLLLAALIWGSAFVAQRLGAGQMAAASFNAVRHYLGFGALTAVVLLFDLGARRGRPEARQRWLEAVLPGVLIGVALTGGTMMQQTGLAFTTAGKAGFITGFYLVLIPLAGWLFLKQRTSWTTWLAIGLAMAGLYLLSITQGSAVNIGDLIVLGGALFWTWQILMIERAGALDPLRLCAVQFLTCALLSTVLALITEPAPFSGLSAAWAPLLYTGLISSGVAFTCQVIGQRDAKASHAAMIMSLEAVFAALAGALILGERLGGRAMTGAALMLLAIIIAQLGALHEDRTEPTGAALETAELVN